MKKLITLTFALFFCAGIAFGQTANVTQSGDDNEAVATQQLNNIDGTGSINITQAGDDNYAESFQSGNSVAGYYLSAINQTGDENEAFQTVSQSLGINVLIDQSGFSGLAEQTIHFGVDDRVMHNYPGTPSFSIDQNGSNNEAYQTAGAAGQLDENLYATITQSSGSSDNVATQVMSGDDIWFNIVQNGAGNAATMKVNNDLGAQAGNSYANITQNGDDNVASALMHNSNRFDVDILQLSSGNNAIVDIQAGTGALNMVDITQSGLGGYTANVTITGDGNTATVTQN